MFMFWVPNMRYMGPAKHSLLLLKSVGAVNILSAKKHYALRNKIRPWASKVGHLIILALNSATVPHLSSLTLSNQCHAGATVMNAIKNAHGKISYSVQGLDGVQ